MTAEHTLEPASTLDVQGGEVGVTHDRYPTRGAKAHGEENQ